MKDSKATRLHLLIVEDDEAYRRTLVWLIRNRFKDAVIHQADCLEQAHRLIHDLGVRAKLSYDAVILDFMLPQQKSGGPEKAKLLPFSLPEYQGSGVEIIQLTAYAADAEVHENIKSIAADQLARGVTYRKVSKFGTEQKSGASIVLDYLADIARAKEYRVGIELAVRQLSATIMDPAFDAIIGYRGRIATRDPSGGFDLRDFLRRCGALWRFLPKDIQFKLKERFAVEERLADGSAVLSLKRYLGDAQATPPLPGEDHGA